jgi:hypothetical protein
MRLSVIKLTAPLLSSSKRELWGRTMTMQRVGFGSRKQIITGAAGRLEERDAL